MCQNRAAYNGQVCIGAHKIVRELLDEIQQLAEGCRFNFHRGMLRIEHNAVLVIVYIGRILHKPVTVVDGYRDNAVILACRMVDPSCIALIFPAQQALGIGGSGHIFCCRNRLRVLFRLGQVDGDIQITVFRRCNPLDILRNAIPADIVGVLAEFVIPVGSRLRVFLIQIKEFFLYLARHRRDGPHQFCVKQVAIDNAVFCQRTGFQRTVT